MYSAAAVVTDSVLCSGRSIEKEQFISENVGKPY